jgi:DNA mismatch repair protein MutL
MPKVIVLPDHVASQIAAGEVVERPASVVKEYVENSIDAGATQIEIAISSDCRDIRIADNGCGMEPDDAVLAFQRHATSKLRSADDLWTLKSLGFRGEALPSIASVSRVTCTTRTHEAAHGSRVECADGKVTVVETGCAKGTVMQVVDLFYNVPARLNFLKKPATEFGHIQETVQTLAIAHPEIAFTLIKQDEELWRSSGSGDLRRTIVEVGYCSGREVFFEIETADDRAKIVVRGIAAKPLHFRGDRKGILAIVNRRPVRCPLTYRALDYAYSDLIPRGKYPLAVINITIDPASVDVNIHPTKKELKYSNGNDAYITIQRAITRALREGGRGDHINHGESGAMTVAESGTAFGAAGEWATSQSGAAADGSTLDNGSDWNSARDFGDSRFGRGQLRSAGAARQIEFGHELATVSLVEADQSGQKPSERRTIPPDWRIAGYIHNTYILLETASGLEIVEQHIAHERVLYERFLAQQSVRGRVTDNIQPFLISQPLNLSPEQEAQIQSNFKELNQLGFDFKWDADGSVACTQVPQELSGKNYAVAIQEILEELSQTDAANFQLEATKSLACQAAIKNGMPLGPSEITQLLSDWLNAPRNDTCPHGRPIRMSYSMEKLFQIFHP